MQRIELYDMRIYIRHTICKLISAQDDDTNVESPQSRCTRSLGLVSCIRNLFAASVAVQHNA